MQRILLTICSVLLLLLPELAFAQVPAFQWGTGMQRARAWDINIDKDNNVITTGSLTQSSDFNPGPGAVNLSASGSVAWKSDGYVRKLDADGNYIWAFLIGGLGSDVGRSVTTDDAGNVYVSGFFQETVDFDPGVGVDHHTSVGMYDAFVAKYDANAQFIWAKTFGSALDEECYEVQVDGSGNVFVSGWFRDSVDFDPGVGVHTLTVEQGWDQMFILKLDSNGDFEWAHTLESGGYSQSESLELDPAGNVYVAGNFRDSADFDPGPGQDMHYPSNFYDNYIWKLSNAGNLIWAKSFGGGGQVHGIRDLEIGPAGNLYVACTYDGTSDLDPGPAVLILPAGSNQYEVATMKFDDSGTLLWANVVGGSSFEHSFGVAIAGNGDVYTTGSFRTTVDFDPGPGVHTITVPGTSNTHAYIQKLKSNGDFDWAESVDNGTSSSYGYGIGLDAYDNLYIAGSASGNQLDVDLGAGTHYIPNTNSGGTWITGYLIRMGDSICVATSGSLTTAGCSPFTSPGGNQVWTSSGTYSDTITNAAGCDSVLTVNFTVLSASSGSTTVATCDSLVWYGTTYTASGIATHTLTNAAGCDSVVTLNLTINNSSVSDTAATVCDSLTWYGNTYYSSGLYTHTLTNAAGCDSLIRLTLTIGNNAATINTSACYNYTVPSGNATYSSSGMYNDTIANANGCDSVLTINLTILDSSSATVNVTACGSYTAPSGKFVWTSSTTYHDTITNAAGCDSLLTINLTILDHSAATVFDTACGSYTSPSGNHVWTSSATYMDTMPNAIGCDSVITVNLTIHQASTSILAATACYSYTSPSGLHVWSQSGTYTDTLTNAVGCDSVITVNLSLDTSATALTVSACNSYTSPSGNHTWTMSGQFADTLQNAAGCDSLLTINLTIGSTSTDTISPTSCLPYTSPSGNYVWTTSGTFADTIINAAGCDSVLVINLTIGTPTGTITTTACDSYTVPSGDETYTSSGIYTDTVLTSAGCDSILTIDLTVLNSTTSSLLITACNSYTVPSGNATYSTSGVYTDTLSNSAGCDSIITVDLTINTATTGTLIASNCVPYTSPSGNHVWASSGTYSDTITNAAGCDSIITVNLTITSILSSTETVYACDSFTVAGNTYTVSGNYFDTTVTAQGCDSAITTILFVINSTEVWDTVNVCSGDSYTYPDGTVEPSVIGTESYTSALQSWLGCDSIIHTTLIAHGVFVATVNDTICAGEDYTYPDGLTSLNVTQSEMHVSNLQTAFGCDSTVTTNVEVLDLNQGISQSGDTLYSAGLPLPGTQYEWLLCGPPHIGLLNSNAPSYVPAVNGLYAVSISLGGCTDTTGCYTVTNVGLADMLRPFGATLYPNPARNATTLELAANSDAEQLVLLDLHGRVLQRMMVANRATVIIPLQELSAGIYVLQVVGGTTSEQLRLVVH